MQLLSQILTVISFIMIGIMLITFRRARIISSMAPLISIAASLIAVVIYLVLVGSSLSREVLLVLGVTGIVLGLWQGRKTKVWKENGKGKAQNTIWFLVIWAVGFVFNQLLVVTGQSLSLNLGIGTMSFSTGITVGAQGMILLKLLKAPPSSSVKCPGCGASVRSGSKFCTGCGKRLIS